jgi:hypothetical protein
MPLWFLNDLPGRTVATCPRAVSAVLRPPAASNLTRTAEDGWLVLVAIDTESDDEANAPARFVGMLAFRNRDFAAISAV